MLPDAGLADGDGNLCRNPNDNLSGPWCFVSLSDLAAGWEKCGLDKCPTALITPQKKRVIPMEMKEYTINCVVKNIYEQISGIEWTTDRETGNSYSPQDGVYEDSGLRTQISSLTLTKDNLIALKNAGEGAIKFSTCTVKVPSYENTLTATHSIIIEEPYEQCYREGTNGDDYRGECRYN